MRRLTLPEHQARAFSPIARPVADALATTGAVKVSADLEGRTILKASSYVGVLRCGEVELRVTPKIGIHRLLWLLGHAHDPSGWRDDDIVDLATVDDLVTAVAVSFHAATRRALTHGVLQGYRTVEEALPLLRGRLREADQLRRRLGLVVPLEVRYDDYTVDIPENRILLTAARRLLRVPGLPLATHAGLRQLLTTLADVTPLVAGDKPPDTPTTRLTRHYQPALRLARIILSGRSIDQPSGSTAASGFLFDLNKAFEDWLTITLRRALEPYGGRLRDQYPSHLDTMRQLRIRPDLVWERRARPAAVLDAKYKRVKDADRPHADLYQMLAYCTALGLPEGHLVYASGDAPSSHTVVEVGTRLRTWVLDLARPTEHILDQVNRIANAVAAAIV
ncbi:MULTISPECIES: McrC family protein [unclassified Crossiella]|uniref:McrC family protein n=1 Tax=unclassified Crossiella TaxID=2620835 RepID=UPI001FFFB9D8|nr:MULTISPECIES: McrC family protein [unclassified Crossiella]MCK2238236.1 McrC family protein [Crossiella sp. S99.2]MCK2256276.1 McrC family protein [Crossiella sp. S99.1]